MPDIDARFALARSIATEAGALALEYWLTRGDLTVEAKASRQDIVSEADRAVERLIKARVAEACPEDGFLGEEYGLAPGASGFDWVVDPIDGTSPYLHGIPNWCVSIAVTHRAETVIGVIAVPTHGEVFTARLGGGAHVNGAALRLPDDLRITNAATGVGASHRTDPDWIAQVTRDLARAGGVFFRNGSGALMLAYVAAGRLAGYVEPYMNAWDCLAGLLMIREAGGRTAAFPAPGVPITEGGAVLAAAPGAWDDLALLMAVSGISLSESRAAS